MVRSKVLGWLLLIGSTMSGWAQDRYMVFFSDKDQVTYSVDEPSAFLSERSLARRAKHNVEVSEQDLPVDADYVQQVAATGVKVFFTTKWFNGVLAEMTTAQTTAVGALPFVDSVQLVGLGAKLQETPGGYEVADTFLEPSNASRTTEVQLSMLDADEMHEDGYRGEGMLIAVFDSGYPGVNAYHPFEHIFAEDRLLGTRDFIGNSGNVFQYNNHGASVLFNIAADYQELIGTAPKASYVLCVTEDLDGEYRIEEYNWVFAAEYADSLGVDVINTSLGYFDFTLNEMDYTYADMDGNTTVIARAAELASAKGMLVVVSAGNEATESWKYITSPGDARGVLTVGSVTSSYHKSSFSSVGPTADGRIKPDVCALGSSAVVFKANPNSEGFATNGKIENGSGTSFSAPQMAGFAAGVWQANPDWTNTEVIESIKMAGTNYANPDSLFGYGVPKYRMAVTGTIIQAVDVFDEQINVYPNPFTDNKVTLDFGEVTLKGKLEILVQDAKGGRIFHDKLDGRHVPNSLEIMIEPTGNGVYFLTLRSKQFKKTVKLVKI